MRQSRELPTEAHAIPLSQPVAQQATIAPDGVGWISRMRGMQTAVDPRATVSYVVAHDNRDGPTLWAGREVPFQVREDFAAGALIQDRYQLIKELGRGGMGVVYLGKDQRLDRSVAVKVILSHDGSASATATMDSRLKTSFADEARLGASLTHPAIATVFDYGFQHDNPFTVFEYIEGETLREVLERRGRLPLDEVRLIVGPLAQALDFAHARRIVHRDLKPENIRATEQRQFKVLDLGLAREFSRQDDWRFAGTPAYAAPEQAAERPSDGRTDQYALAVIVFELLTGRRPFVSDSWLDLLEMHFSTPPPRPRSLDPDLPETIDEAILKALNKDPNRRFSTCTELAVALGCQFLTGPAPLPAILLETEVKKMGGRWKSVFYPFSLRRPPSQLTLAPDALWAIHWTELMRWPLPAVHDLRARGMRGLSFRVREVAGNDRQWFRFNTRDECRRWRESLAAQIPAGRELEPVPAALQTGPQTALAADTKPDPQVEPVVLLAGRPGTPFQLLGMVEAKGPTKRRVENGLAVRAAMMRADAVIDLNIECLPGFVRTEYRASGTAVRVGDDRGRLELTSRWLADQIGRFKVLLLTLVFLDFLCWAVLIPSRSLILDLLRRQPPASVLGVITAVLSSNAPHMAFTTIMTTLTLGSVISRRPRLVRPTALCFIAYAVHHCLMLLDQLARVISSGLPFVPMKRVFTDFTFTSTEVQSNAESVFIIFVMLWNLSWALLYLYVGRRLWRAAQEYRRSSAGSLRSAVFPARRRLLEALAWCAAISGSLGLIGPETWEMCHRVAKAFVPGASRKELIEQKRVERARQSNEKAWRLITAPDPGMRDPQAALRTALQNAKAEGDNPQFLKTLGVARYRTGDFTESVAVLERTVNLGGGTADMAFFLAAALAETGRLDEATKAFATVDEWMRREQPSNSELQRFREEAAAVLYMRSKGDAGPQRQEGPPAVLKPSAAPGAL